MFIITRFKKILLAVPIIIVVILVGIIINTVALALQETTVHVMTQTEISDLPAVDMKPASIQDKTITPTAQTQNEGVSDPKQAEAAVPALVEPESKPTIKEETFSAPAPTPQQLEPATEVEPPPDDVVDVENAPADTNSVNDDQWWTQEEYDLLVQVVWCEAGSDGISDRAQQLVAMVVLNRVNGAAWPDTIYDVVYQPGQYGCLYSPNWGTTPTPRIYDNVLTALNGEVDCPSNVVYQSDCLQGSGQYERYETMWSPIVFCYE